MKVSIGTVYWVAAVLLVFAWFCFCWGADFGNRRGRCMEMCRPAQFDSDQKVNGGCLCIGSDKVLRFKDAP